jgi:hypothetical protein
VAVCFVIGDVYAASIIQSGRTNHASLWTHDC